ncbi:MAG: hypothetical protein U1E51_01990 [Candidatus Binatia bacterium]|nr:hypothetical protein [Candidatus Binatia bacterium]
MSDREQLLAEIKTFAPETDAARAKELQELVTKRAALQYPGNTFGDDNGRKCFEQGIRFTIQTIFAGGR